MLNEREKRAWAGIEQELTADRGFTRTLSRASEPERRAMSTLWRGLYPELYLSVAVIYMLMAIGGGAAILGDLLVFALVVWLGVQVSAKLDKNRTKKRPRLSAR